LAQAFIQVDRQFSVKNIQWCAPSMMAPALSVQRFPGRLLGRAQPHPGTSRRVPGRAREGMRAKQEQVDDIRGCNSPMVQKQATFIPMQAKHGEGLEGLLRVGGGLVRETEPGTKLRFGLTNDTECAIFDTFADEDGRMKHFSGKVAAALSEQAAALVEGAWDNGVVKNIANSTILGCTYQEGKDQTEACLIKLTAAEGKEAELKALLEAAVQVIRETEEFTIFWSALQFSETEFGIFDTFVNEEGRAHHFAGRVAGVLKDKAAELVEGGWENGVLKKVHNYHIVGSNLPTIQQTHVEVQLHTTKHPTAQAELADDDVDGLHGGTIDVQVQEQEDLERETATKPGRRSLSDWYAEHSDSGRSDDDKDYDSGSSDDVPSDRSLDGASDAVSCYRSRQPSLGDWWLGGLEWPSSQTPSTEIVHLSTPHVGKISFVDQVPSREESEEKDQDEASTTANSSPRGDRAELF